jgi:hypothetical protein
MISVWLNTQGIIGRALAVMPHGLIPESQCMDVFNPAVRSLLWKYMNQAFFSIGADGFWQDATESGDDGNAISGDNSFSGSANRVRYACPLFARRATYEGQRSTDSGKRVMILTDAFNKKDQRDVFQHGNRRELHRYAQSGQTPRRSAHQPHLLRVARHGARMAELASKLLPIRAAAVSKPLKTRAIL